MKILLAGLFFWTSLGDDSALMSTRATKLAFWDTPRRGANCFNREVNAEYFRSAKEAGIEFLRLAPDKWPSRQKDFLIGNADGYKTLDPDDLRRLRRVLDDAQAAGVRIVLTMLSLPGARWRQLNDGKDDSRLWREPAFAGEAESFWCDLARSLADHPAIVGYNPLNEPHPERVDGIHDFWTQDLAAWLAGRRGSSYDPNEFNRRMVAAIRRADAHTPVILDAAMFAGVPAFRILEPVRHPGVLYSFHLYEPYELTNRRVNAGRFRYPGVVEVGEKAQRVEWNRGEIGRFLRPVVEWAERHRVPAKRVLAGEFGCHRTTPGGPEYLGDVLDLIEARGWHWAFYSYREDTWDGMDYECGAEPLGAAYWQLVDAGQSPERPRKANPLWQALQARLQPVPASPK